MLEQIDMFAKVSKDGEAGRTGYDADDIQVLEGLVAVRKRPGMYIGSTSSSGLHHLVWEIVDNAVDEHLAKFCSKIDITLRKDGSVTVIDNGRGIPTGMHKTGVPTPQVVFTILHAGGKFGGSGYKNQADCTALALRSPMPCPSGWRLKYTVTAKPTASGLNTGWTRTARSM